MSAPDTNVKKQARRHRPALIGIALAVVFGVLFFLFDVGSGVDDEGPVVEGAETDGTPEATGDGNSSPAVAE